MKRIVRLVFAFASVFVLTSCTGLPKKNMNPAIMIIPARYTVVQVAFDVQALRPATLIAYDNSDPADPMIHVWNRRMKEWARIGMEDIAGGNIVTPAPNRVILVGEDKILPAGMTDSLAWSPKVIRIQTLGVADLLTDVGRDMSFSKGEWKWLAKRHRLSLVDKNAELRRYGRWGKPGAKKEPVMPEGIEEMQEESIDPVAVPVEEVPKTVAPEDK